MVSVNYAELCTEMFSGFAFKLNLLKYTAATTDVFKKFLRVIYHLLSSADCGVKEKTNAADF